MPHVFLAVAGEVTIFLLAQELEAGAGDTVIRRQRQGPGRHRSRVVTSQSDLGRSLSCSMLKVMREVERYTRR